MCVCVCVCVCTLQERERVCLCVYTLQERESVCVCVCILCKRERVCVSVCVYVAKLCVFYRPESYREDIETAEKVPEGKVNVQYTVNACRN